MIILKYETCKETYMWLMLTALGIVISFRLWTIRNEAPKYKMISIWRTLNDYTRMGMSGLITHNDYLK